MLLSGGLDSTTVLAIASAQGFVCHALTVNYGQRHAGELACAQRVARAAGVTHREIALDLAQFGGSALTDPHAAIPDQPVDGIPATYVPARNTVLLAIALSFAETLGAQDIFIGANAVDYSGYPDCRPEYLESFEHLANLATRAAVEGAAFTIHAPVLHMTKGQIIKIGGELGVDYGLTSSCYDPSDDGTPCGVCDACRLRAKGFTEAGIADPLLAVHRVPTG